MSDFDWDEGAIARLHKLWGEGHSTQKIADLMGTTKHAIVGKAHRLGLMARPSPILRDAAPKPRKPRPLAKGASTLAPLAAPMQEAAPSRAAAPVPGCQWVTQMGRLSAGRPWLFCGAPVDRAGGAWCAKHYADVYVPVAPLASLSPEEREQRMQRLMELSRSTPRARNGSSFGFDLGRVGT
jgi:GcrA cell cycle regulator